MGRVKPPHFPKKTKIKMKTSITRYIVRNAKGEYQSAYSTKLGNKEAFKYAELTAKDVFGTIYSVDTDGNEIEVVSFPKPEPKKKNKKITQKAA